MRHLLGCRNPFHPLHGWSHQRHGSISLSTHTILSQLTHRFRMPFCMLERLISCVVFVCFGVVILCFYVVDIRFSVYAIRVTLSTWTLDVEIARRAINTRLHRAHAMQLQILLPAPATLVSGRELQSSNMRVFWGTRLGAHWPIAERCIWLSGRAICVFHNFAVGGAQYYCVKLRREFADGTRDGDASELFERACVCMCITTLSPPFPLLLI